MLMIVCCWEYEAYRKGIFDLGVMFAVTVTNLDHVRMASCLDKALGGRSDRLSAACEADTLPTKLPQPVFANR